MVSAYSHRITAVKPTLGQPAAHQVIPVYVGRLGCCKDNHMSTNSKEYEREYTQKIKKQVLSHYSSGMPVCAYCGITDIDILTIDHIEGGGSKHRQVVSCGRGGLAFYKWLRRNGFPNGYQLLCYNCNIKRQRIKNAEKTTNHS